LKRFIPFALASLIAVQSLVFADPKAFLIDELSGYLEFVDYGGATIFAEQIPRDECAKMMIIDARDLGQLAKSHIPGAIEY
jgi:hypothetical protein